MKDFTIDKETYIREIALPHHRIYLGAGGHAANGARQRRYVGKRCRLSETDCLSELKFPDELVRHKILDILGDISLVGPLHAHIIAVMGSHKLNAALAAKLRVLKK